MAELIRGLDAESVRRRADAVREDIADACARRGRDPDDVELLAAVKYVDVDELPVLAEAGLRLLGENRAQALEEKAAAWSRLGLGPVRWDFIGHLQSRKVKTILPHVGRIHSVASDSVLEQLRRHTGVDQAQRPEVLIEVNVAGEEGKSGIAPVTLADVIARCPIPVAGLMTMPPLAADPEDSRRWFAALAQLAAEHGLRELSMGTSQDFAVAVEEGATVVRIGATLYR